MQDHRFSSLDSDTEKLWMKKNTIPEKKEVNSRNMKSPFQELSINSSPSYMKPIGSPSPTQAIERRNTLLQAKMAYLGKDTSPPMAELQGDRSINLRIDRLRKQRKRDPEKQIRSTNTS